MGDDSDSSLEAVKKDDGSIDFRAAEDYFNTVKEDNDYFKQMLDLIPAQSYFDRDTQLKIISKAENESKLTQGKKRKAVNPISVKSVTQIQAELENYIEPESEEEDESEFTEIKPSKIRKSGPSPKPSAKSKSEKLKGPNVTKTTLQGSTTDTGKTKSSVSGNKKDGSKLKNSENPDWSQSNKKTDRLSTAAGAMNGGLSDNGVHQVYDTEEKRAILRAKIEALQAKRNLKVVDKEELRQQRRENKLKQKQKKKEMKKNKGNTSETGQTSRDESDKKGRMSSPVYNSEGKMVFSKFDFTPSKKEKGKLSGKDYKRLLETVEKRNQKIKKLKETDQSKAKILEDKFKWEAALQKADGMKVKDNPELLKKAMKKKEKMRDQKKKKWGERTAFTKKLKDDKQAKRNKNIQARKQTKKDNKIKKAKKKGRILPGF